MDIFQQAIYEWGQDKQLDMVTEECAELIVAVNKYRRGKGVDGIIEEAVDVELCLTQIRRMFPDQLDNWEKIKGQKLDRLYYKLHPEKKHE